ncbi:MAG: phosphopantetheine-binding protein [Planctomycetota bacterium]|nr:phosphopantetheine-binding protein [Planctomycetota bacterium]
MKRLESIPRNGNGKVRRDVLRKEAAETLGAQERAPVYDVAPRNLSEASIASIWRDVLETESLGIHDDFFHLGGTSLQAMQLSRRVEERFGVMLPLSQFFEAGTVASMAAFLDSKSIESAVKLIRIRECKERRALYIMPGITGQVPLQPLFYEGINASIYGVQPNLDAERRQETTDFRSLANLFASALMEREGPYALSGFSYGGFLAYEVACILQANGKKVSSLTILDAGPGRRGLVSSNPALLAVTILRIAYNFPRWMLEEIKELDMSDAFGRLYRFALRMTKTLTGKRNVEFGDIWDEGRLEPHYREQLRATFQSVQSYVPGEFEGRVTLVRSQAQPLLSGFGDDLGWGRFASEVRIHKIPGNHVNMLRPPQSDQVVAILNRILSES